MNPDLELNFNPRVNEVKLFVQGLYLKGTGIENYKAKIGRLIRFFLNGAIFKPEPPFNIIDEDMVSDNESANLRFKYQPAPGLISYYNIFQKIRITPEAV